MTQMPVKYPIGIQSFEMLRKLSYLYIDKTELIYNLAMTSKCIFLARPRRFGKSLLLSTVQAYFEGKRELFKGLAIGQLGTDWQPHAVLKLSLASYNPSGNGDLEEILDNQFQIWEQQYDVEIKASSLSSRFGNIIRAAHGASGRPVVILIDEYDHPLISNMHDADKLEAHRLLLKSIYVNIKDLDQYIRFTMLTGVSRFSKMTIFSGLNNLEDISFDDEYAAICGITEDDIYNPFSLLNALKKKKIDAYWFQSGTPEFLIRRIQDSNEFLPDMFDESVEGRILSSSDILDSRPTSLLYQTGYLTIKRFEMPDVYHLGIPNLEVRKGLFQNLARYYFDKDDTVIFNHVREVRKLLEAKQIGEAMERLRTFMAGIPYEFADKATELHYENNLFIIFMLIGVDARPEWHTSDGRIDLLLSMRNYFYITGAEKF